MAQTDPARRRVDAAELLLASADNDDQVGVIAFGDSPRWMSANRLVRRSSFQLQDLARLGQADQHTDFRALFEEWERFLNSQADDFFESHDVQLVILTDGVPDAANQSRDENATNALRIVRESATRSTISAIALGATARSGSFLTDLVRIGGGRSAYADTDLELTHAFLEVATSVLHLPAFQQFKSSGDIKDFGPASRSLLILLGEAHPQGNWGTPILDARTVHIFDASELGPGAHIRWDGSGTAYYCRRERLEFRTTKPIASAGLLSDPPQLIYRLFNGRIDQSEAFFLQGSELAIIADSIPQANSELIPLPLRVSGEFSGPLDVRSPGKYHLTAKLRAHYGEIEQDLGEYIVSSTALEVPPQSSLNYFPSLPNWFLRQEVKAKTILPVGSATISFHSSKDLVVSPSSGTLLPTEAGKFQIYAKTATPSQNIYELPYTVEWSDGSRRRSDVGVLRIATRRLAFWQAAHQLWDWLLLLCVSVLVAFGAWKRFRPRNLRGKLQITKGSTVVFSAVLPEDLRAKRLDVRTNSSLSAVTQRGSVIELPGTSDDILLSIERQRFMGREDAVVRPGRARLEVSGRRVSDSLYFSEIPKSQLSVPAEDLLITFR